MIKSLLYSVRQATKQITRNMTMTVTSLLSITAMLLILGMFFMLVVNINILAESAKDQFDMVEVYILDDATDVQVDYMQEQISRNQYVENYVFLSKDDAMAEMRERWGDNSYLLENLTSNPLPRSLRVKLKNVEDAQKLVDYAKSLDGVEDIKYSQSEVNKILKVTNAIQIGAMIIIIFLIVVSVVVVSNTIKLTVLARGNEISIMKYVGATNWFIRGPFLAEGIIIGIIAALVSAGIVSVLYRLFCDNLSQQILVLLSTGLYPVGFMTENLLIIFTALGVRIGAMGSIISMRRFLDT